jgi:hypothetical protein
LSDRPRRNRVTPFGTIEASPHKGRYLGNRGDLHQPDGTLGRTWRVSRWIVCTLEGRNGYRVTFDRPGCYYPLFFADEAVTLAAGHRPCAQCRRADFLRFGTCWRLAHGLQADRFVSATEIDRALHPARIDRNGCQATHSAMLGDLPDGVFVTLADAPGVPLLLWEGCLPWSHQGYAVPPCGSPRHGSPGPHAPAHRGDTARRLSATGGCPAGRWNGAYPRPGATACAVLIDGSELEHPAGADRPAAGSS